MNRLVKGLFVSLLFAVTADAVSVIYLTNWKISPGDDPSWSEPGFDDSGWEEVPFQRIPHSDSVLWIRIRIEMDEEPSEIGKPLGIYFAALASHEIWWDGRMVGRGGVVGSSAAREMPGPVEAHYVIPGGLTQRGEHVIAVRTSHFHRHFVPSTGYWVALVGPYDRLINPAIRSTQTALVSLSGIVVMAIFSFMMFFVDLRERAYLFLGLLCVTAGLLLVAESWRALVGYTYNWHLLRLLIVTGLAWVLDILLLVFLARRFPMKHAKWFVGTGAILATIPILAPISWDPKVILGFLSVFILSFGWCVTAAFKRHPGSILAALGLSFCLLALFQNPGAFVDRNIYPSLNVLMIFLLASHALQVRRIRRDREKAQLKSARLETELLRRHIQPHFLMNTLTALSEWIEQEPRVAIEMIEALSEEFRLLSDIASRSLIPIEEELRLCRSHLEIMSRRKGRSFELRTVGIDPRDSVPPAVLHTLIENAITHNDYAASSVVFELTRERRTNGVTLRMTTPLTAKGAEEGGEIVEGTGLRYIRARLKESYGRDGSLSYGKSEGSWITEIGIPASTP